jgi:hypothetical protein
VGGLGLGVAQSPLKSLTSCAMRRLPDKAWRIPKTSVVGRLETDFLGIFRCFSGENSENVGTTIFWTGRYLFIYLYIYLFIYLFFIYIYIHVFGGYSEIPWSFFKVYMFDYLGNQFVGKRGTDAQMNKR